MPHAPNRSLTPSVDPLASKLDLEEYLRQLQGFFARPKPVEMTGDIHQHIRYIRALEGVNFPEPPAVETVDDLLARLRKQAVLSLKEIHRFVIIITYLNRLKAITFQEPLAGWLRDVEIPDPIRTVLSAFTDEGEINPAYDPQLQEIDAALAHNTKSLKEQLRRLTRNRALGEYLVDTQVHLHNGEETLLVRGGFSQVLDATVVGRSSGGFFYVVPRAVDALKRRRDQLIEQRELVLWQHARTFSEVLHRWVRFLAFADGVFDRFDHYQARVRFARARDEVFLLPVKGHRVVLADFVHPALRDPVPVTLKVERSVTLLTGVNAGGKTMLLKSILSAVYLARRLLPMRCDPHRTQIGTFKGIEAIIDDPQSVRNDISTFAGRMVAFGKLFGRRGLLVGVDEIELGTDADEAAALFKVLLETLRDQEITFVVTTHHKRLAALMGDDEDVELVAALYDEARRRPTYTYLQGSIGKSYAFETAERYGIAPAIIERAKAFYGEDKERLGELIERSSELERTLRSRIAEVEKVREDLAKKEASLARLETQMKEEQRKVLATYENRYNAATKRALAALKAKDSAEGRRKLNEAHRHKQAARPKPKPNRYRPQVGDRIKYRSHRGEVLSLKSDEATIIVDGLKMRVPIADLRPTQEPPPKPAPPKATASTQVDRSRARVSIKLLGMYADEAIEAVDRFLSDALVNGLSEVEIIHGTGTGVLAKVVSEYLREHPKIREFYRPKGNLGTTIVTL
jgi:DNA mismatch repair protein MutS2